MTQVPTIKQIGDLISHIAEILNNEQIPYLVVGSFAYSQYVQEESMQINDVDIMIMKEDLTKVEHLLRQPEMPYQVYPFELGIHANHTSIKGNDGKPFDLSFEIYDHPDKSFRFTLDDYHVVKIGDVEVKVIKKEEQKYLYEMFLDSKWNTKREAYIHKIARLSEN